MQPSAGGLAAALGAVRGDAVWIGWPGTVVPEHLQPDVTKRLEEDNLVPVFLSEEEEEDFYGRVCNDTLWPLLTPYGLRPIGQVAVDEEWSALRFRPLKSGEEPFSGGR